MPNANDEMVLFRCSVQRALLGRVVPGMRAVSVELTPSSRIIRVFFDMPATPEELDLLSDAEGEVLADYSDNDLIMQVKVLSWPTRIPPDQGTRVYERYEPDPSAIGSDAT